MKTCKLKSNTVCSCEKIIEQVVNVATGDDQPFVRHFYENQHIISVFVVDEYYFRNDSNLSVTFIVDEQLDYTTVEIVVSGGKVGLLQVSYGAEGASVKRMKKSLKNIGFEEIDIE